jgi:hypothetical protein
MIFLLLFAALLAVLILWIVFMPVYIIVNTRRGVYSIHQALTFRISLHPGQQEFLKAHAFGFAIPRDQDQTLKKKRPQVKGKSLISENEGRRNQSLPGYFWLRAFWKALNAKGSNVQSIRAMLCLMRNWFLS